MGDVRAFQRIISDPENPSKKSRVGHALRDHSISRMLKVGRLDEVRYAKAVELANLHKGEVVGVKAFDPTRPFVDQSGHCEPQMARIDAVEHLRAVMVALGPWAYEWLKEILFDETDFTESCKRRFNLDEKKRIAGVVHVFHDILDRAWDALEESRRAPRRHRQSNMQKIAA